MLLPYRHSMGLVKSIIDSQSRFGNKEGTGNLPPPLILNLIITFSFLASQSLFQHTQELLRPHLLLEHM